MRRIAISLLSAGTLSLAAAPVLAQSYAPAPAGTTYPTGGGVTTPATTYTPAPTFFSGPLMILEAPFAMFGGGGVASDNPHPNCGVIRYSQGGMTAVCGP